MKTLLIVFVFDKTKSVFFHLAQGADENPFLFNGIFWREVTDVKSFTSQMT